LNRGETRPRLTPDPCPVSGRRSRRGRHAPSAGKEHTRRIRTGLAAITSTALAALAAAPAARANTWDFSGIIEFCNPIACNIAGIGQGDELFGFLKANDDASGPNQTFGATDIFDYLILTGSVEVGADDSNIDSAKLTTDDADEIASGTISFSGTFDGIFGLIDLSVTLTPRRTPGRCRRCS
jgi:hypothetical protein